MASAEEIIGQQLLHAAKVVEEQVDAEIKKYEDMGEDDLEALRNKRMQALKKQQQQKRDWIAAGHGSYTELQDEKEFLSVWKQSSRVACHFYRDDTPRCKILDMHLKALAPKHPETRITSINADKCPFLLKRLNIKVIPTIALIHDGKTIDYIRGFVDLGESDEFPTDLLEWRIAKSGVIGYTGDLSKPPTGKKEPAKTIFGYAGKSKNKSVRDKDDSDSDDDW